MQTRPSPFHDASSYEGLPGRQSLPTSTMSGILSGRAMVYPEAERGQTGPDSLARWKRRPARGPRGGAPRRPGRSGWGPAHDAAQRARRLSAVLHRAWAHDEVPAVRDGEAVVEAADAGGADVEACAEEEVVLLVEHATDVGVGELFLVELGAALEEGCRGAKSRFLGQSVFCQTGGFVFCHVSLVVYRSWTGGKRGGGRRNMLAILRCRKPTSSKAALSTLQTVSKGHGPVYTAALNMRCGTPHARPHPQTHHAIIDSVLWPVWHPPFHRVPGSEMEGLIFRPG